MTAPRVSIAELVREGALTVGDGYRTKRSEHGRPGYRILRVADVLEGRISTAGADFVSEEFRRQIGNKLSEAGDVVLTTKGTVGRVARIPDGTEPLVYSPQVCFFRVLDESLLSPRYLEFWFRSEDFKRQASHRANNTDMAAYINLADIHSLALELPSIDEQKAIAEVLGAFDDKIAANARLALTAEQLLASMFAAASLDAEIGRSADGPPIDAVLVLNPKLPAPIEDEPVYVDMQKLPTSGMSVADWGHRPAKGGARFQNGDTLLARITPCLENGKTGYVDFLADDQVGLGSTEYIVMRSVAGRSPGVAYFLATSPRFRKFAIRHMVGSSGRQRLSVSDLRGYRLTQPDEDAMRRFEQTADTLMPRIGAARDESRTLARMRDALLPQLMSGKIRVRDAERVVEGVG